MKRMARRVVVLLSAALLGAGTAQAQTIAGVVRDSSGAVLPGATVEVASPALIEKVRSATTDGAGQYRIVSLSPGLYSVTVSMPGFNTHKREGIELTTDFTATVSADLRVGAVEETITVSGASPTVDVQAVARQTVLTREILDALPTARNIQAAGALIPGVTTGNATLAGGGKDVGGTTMLQQPGLVYRGSTQSQQLWDGFWLSNLTGTGVGGAISFYVNDAGAQELTYTVAAADSVELAAPGVAVNMVPKDGGNTFRGTLFADFTSTPWSWSNLSDDLRARGLTNVAKVHHISDFNPGFGGPLLKDRLWFFAAYRYSAIDTTLVDIYHDKNPAPYIYEPDETRPARDNGKIPNTSIRMTYQAGSKDKFTGWVTSQHKYRANFSLQLGHTPDARAVQRTPDARATVIKWTRTQTSRLLLEGGFSSGHTLYIENYKPHVTPTTYGITDQANGKSFNAYVPGYHEAHSDMQGYKGAMTYVTGSHALKGGMMLGRGVARDPNSNTGDITMTFDGGAPQGVTFRIPVNPEEEFYPDLTFFAQDRWTYKRATVTGGLRYDYYAGRALAGTLPASRWNPETPFDELEVMKWKDFSPRVGVAYDLFGTGKTAVKVSAARYVDVTGTSVPRTNNPQLTIGRTDTRTWRDLNGDFTIFNADGSLQSPELGPTSNQNFGRVIVTNQTTDPATLLGWNARGSTVEWQALVQHELLPRVGITGAYYYRYLGNQIITDNTLLTASDYDGPFCITAPASADLPGGGGFAVCDLYDIKPAARGRVQNHRTFARNFGGIDDHIQGLELSADARLGGGSFVRGGVDANQRVLDNCETTALDNPEVRYCRTTTPYRPDFKVSASHTLPGDFVVSATYQNSQGPQITASWNAPNASIAPSLGRNLAAGTNATKSVQLIEPGSSYGRRLNQLDLRVAKRLRFGRARLALNANLYNATNDDFASSVNTTFSTTGLNEFLRPTGVLQGRLFKIGGQIDF